MSPVGARGGRRLEWGRVPFEGEEWECRGLQSCSPETVWAGCRTGPSVWGQALGAGGGCVGLSLADHRWGFGARAGPKCFLSFISPSCSLLPFLHHSFFPFPSPPPPPPPLFSPATCHSPDLAELFWSSCPFDDAL